MSDEYRPREHDHLVEPMLAGLRDACSGAESVPEGLWARVWRAVKRFVARSWRRERG